MPAAPLAHQAQYTRQDFRDARTARRLDKSRVAPDLTSGIVTPWPPTVSIFMAERKHTHESDENLAEDAVEPDQFEPTDEEVTGEHDAAGPQAPTEPEEAPLSTSLVPVTTIQQYLTEIRRYPYLTKEEEIRLFEEYQQGGSREAAMKLILANLRVSVSIASEYLHTGADHMDLIQEGNVGLLQAIKKFDPIIFVENSAFDHLIVFSDGDLTQFKRLTVKIAC